jgi:hypothetical protein
MNKDDIMDKDLIRKYGDNSYIYCPCCKKIDERGYKGKRCKWCCTLLRCVKENEGVKI